MGNCPSCNHSLEEGQAVCPSCGADISAPEVIKAQKKRHSYGSICGKCGALLPDGNPRCLICGTGRDEIPYDGKFPVEREDEAPLPPIVRAGGAVRKTPHVWRRWAGMLSCVILLCIVGFIGQRIYFEFFDTSSYRAGDVVAYESGNGRLMLNYPGLEQPIQVTGIDLEGSQWAAGALRASDNGRWLAYTAATGQLYLIDLARPAGGSPNLMEAVLLDDNLKEPADFAGTSSYLVYLTREQELYASDRAESWKLDDGVEEIIGLEQNRVLYARRGDRANEGLVDLFLYYLPKDGGEWLTIDRGVSQVLDWTGGFERLLYTSMRQNREGQDELCLHLFDQRANTPTTNMLITGVGEIIDASAETASVVYLIPRQQLWSYGYFFDDDLAASDARILEPRLEDYPALEEAVRVYGEEGDFYNIEDNEELLEEDRQYNAAYRAWEEKLERDELRRRLRALFNDKSGFAELCDLYVYRGGELTRLDTAVWAGDGICPENGQVSVSQGYVLYEKVETSGLSRLKLSTLWQRPAGERDVNLLSYFLRNADRGLYYAPLDGGEPVALYVRGGSFVHRQWRMSPRADGVYFAVGAMGEGGEGATNELYYAAVRAGVPGEAVLVATGTGEIIDALRDGILYTAGEEDETYLYYVQGQSAPQGLGGAGASPGTLENGNATLLYYDGSREEGTASLHMFTREDIALADNVVAYDYRSDNMIYLLKQDGGDTVDIYAWTGGRETLLAQNVNGVLGQSTSG